MVRVYPIVPYKLYVSARTAAMSTQEKHRLRKAGVSAVVNLWHTPDKEMQELLSEGNYAHHPLTDGRTIDDTLVSAAVNAVYGYILRRNTVLVHCYGGRNRAGLICCLVMRRWLKISGAEAADRFITARPNSLVNQHFQRYLRGLPKL